MSLMLVLIAALLAAGVNFCLRKNFERQRSANGYLALYFVFSFLISFAFRRNFDLHSFSAVMISVGMVAGILNLLMMCLVARALKIGPSGLTFAFQNSGSMFPSLLLYILFGRAFGFNFDIPLWIGFLCVGTGLFLSVWKPKGNAKEVLTESKLPSRTLLWVVLALAIFAIQGIILSIFQWRSLLLEYPAKCHFLLPWTCSAQEDLWFAPAFFLLPALLQSLFFGFSERRWLSQREFILGTIGGLLNGGSTFCLLLATRYAGSGFRPILFPLFAVGVIFLCNLWGKKFYQEPIEWKGLLLCMSGIFIGSSG